MNTTDVVRLYNEICILQTVKKTLWEFNHMAIDVKKVIKSTVDDYVENLTVIQEEITALRVEYCQKDDEGKAVVARRYNKDVDGKLTITEEQYVGLVRGEQPNFDARFKELNNAVKGLGEAIVTYGEDKRPIEEKLHEIKPVKRSQVPVDWDGNREEIFWDFIEENKKTTQG